MLGLGEEGLTTAVVVVGTGVVGGDGEDVVSRLMNKGVDVVVVVVVVSSLLSFVDDVLLCILLVVLSSSSMSSKSSSSL
jgi:hypothetical protein